METDAVRECEILD